MRIKTLPMMGAVAEIKEAFSLKYSEERVKGLCTAAKIKRVYDLFRPIRVASVQEDSDKSAIELQHTDTMRRHVTLYSMQQQAKQFLDDVNLADTIDVTALVPPNGRNESGSNLEILHASFVEWCKGLGADIDAATNTRIALQQALVLNQASKEGQDLSASTCINEEAQVKKNGISTYMSMRLCDKQRSFVRKVADLLTLHDAHALSEKSVGKIAFRSEDFVAPGESAQHNDDTTQRLIGELEKSIQAMENSLLEAHEKKQLLSSRLSTHMLERKTKFLGYFFLPNGKVRHYSAGVTSKGGDAHTCRVLLAKHGYRPDLKRKWSTHIVIL